MIPGLQESRLRKAWEIWVSRWMLLLTGVGTHWLHYMGVLVDGMSKDPAGEAAW